MFLRHSLQGDVEMFLWAFSKHTQTSIFFVAEDLKLSEKLIQLTNVLLIYLQYTFQPEKNKMKVKPRLIHYGKFVKAIVHPKMKIQWRIS